MYKPTSRLILVSGEDEWKESLPYQITAGVVIIVMALVLFAAVSYQCAATWRWILHKTCRDTSDGESVISKQAAIRISHSLPDLQTEPLKQEYVQEHKEIVKKVSNLVKLLFKCPVIAVVISVPFSGQS